MTAPKAIDQVRAALAPFERGDLGSYQKYLIATGTANMHEILADYSAMEAEIARLRETLSSIVKSWDERSKEREQFKTHPELPDGYWSPAASMVESRVIAEARAALTTPNCG